MGIFSKQKNPDKYHLPNKAAEWELQNTGLAQLEIWAGDENCIQQQKVAIYLTKHSVRLREEEARAREAEVKRQEAVAEAAAREEAQLKSRKDALDREPFDPRSEISADARHIAGRIVTALWVIFVLLPVVAIVLYEVLK